MKKTIVVKRVKPRYYVFLIIVLALALWFNIERFRMDNISCSTINSGECKNLPLYTLYVILGYLSIIILIVQVLHIYLFNTTIEVIKVSKRQYYWKVFHKQKKTRNKIKLKEVHYDESFNEKYKKEKRDSLYE